MWFETKGTAKRPHPYEKPQEGQRLIDRKSMSICQFSASADKYIIKPHIFRAVYAFWQNIQWKVDNTSFLPPCYFIVDHGYSSEQTPSQLQNTSVLLSSLLLNTHVATPNPTPHIYNGQKHSSHVPSIHTETHTWNQQYSHGTHGHSESSHNKMLWNGKSTMLSHSLCRCWKT